MGHNPRYRDAISTSSLSLLLLSLLLLAVPLHRFQSEPFDPIQDIRSEGFKVVRMSAEDGLPHSIIHAILIDSRGFLWAATRDGLTRYDGHTFIRFSAGTLPVRVLAEDSSGNIWAGTPEALHRFNRKSGKFAAYQDYANDSESISNRNVSSLLTDRDGALWIGTANGLNRFNEQSNTFTRYLFEPDLRHNVASLFEDRAGNLWAGVNGIHRRTGVRESVTFVRRYGGRSFERIRLPTEICRRHVESLRLFVDPNGFICHLIGTRGINRKLHLLRFDPHSLHLVDTVSSIIRFSPQNRLFGSQDSASTDWFAKLSSPLVKPIIGNSGLYLAEMTYHPDNARLLSLTIDFPPFFPARIQGLQQDRGGLHWACSEDGLFKIARSSFFFPPPLRIVTPREAGHLLCRIRAIHKDRRGDLWVGTDDQLLQYHTGTGRVTDHGDRYSASWENSRRATNVIFEAPPFLYFGTNTGLHRYDPVTGDFSQPFPLLTGKRPRSIALDRDGNLWVGTISDINVFAPDGSVLYCDSLGPDRRHLKDAIWELHCDSKGRMWGGAETGLYRWDSLGKAPRYYQHFTGDPHSLPKGSAWSIHEDRRGNIWVGVYGGGLARYRPATDDFVTITEQDGLPSTNICAIQEDRAGNLWLSTSNGLACYTAPDSATGVDLPRRILTYTTGDGLIGKEFALKAAWCDTNGVLYFGGVNQVTRFDPATLRKNPHVPPLAVTSFRANDSLISLELLDGDSVVLPYDRDHIALEFAALDFLNPEGNLYSYKLEGVDYGWNYTGNRRYASYSDIEPGDYVLHIRGANSHGVWNHKGIRIHIRITPPLWGTVWFRLLALGSALSVGFVSLRAWQRRRRERGERRIIEARLQALRLQMKPHFIFNSLNSIHSFILLHKSDEAAKYLTKFASLMRVALYHSEHSSISLHDELQFLHLYSELEALRFDSSFAYDISVSPEIPLDTVRLPSMLIQPYVENAIHHGLRNKVRGELSVRFEMEGNYLICRIADNGIGREGARARRNRNEKHRSMGTSVTQQRLELLNAIHEKEFRVEIIDLYNENHVPAGTLVVLRIPLLEKEQV